MGSSIVFHLRTSMVQYVALKTPFGSNRPKLDVNWSEVPVKCQVSLIWQLGS